MSLRPASAEQGDSRSLQIALAGPNPKARHVLNTDTLADTLAGREGWVLHVDGVCGIAEFVPA